MWQASVRQRRAMCHRATASFCGSSDVALKRAMAAGVCRGPEREPTDAERLSRCQERFWEHGAMPCNNDSSSEVFKPSCGERSNAATLSRLRC